MVGNDWDILLQEEFTKEYFVDLLNKVKLEYQENIVYPYFNNIFKALKLTSYKQTKVVILGQDPYHGIGQAHGLSFSVQDGITPPPSLKNIYKELYEDLNIKITKNGNLTKWATQGVLMLNSILSVEKDKPASHQKIGWQKFTDKIISLINEKQEPVVFILWGSYAKSKKELITNSSHLIIESAHPSPFSADKGFFGSKPFSKTNNFLIKNNLEPIHWQL